MSRILDYDDNEIPQNQRDFNDDVRRILNFGKYQPQVVTTPPAWTGRQGEWIWVFSNNRAYMYICTTDNSTTWRAVTSSAVL